MDLVLNSYGASLSKDHEGFLITTKDGKQRIPTDGIKSILISKGAQITSDAAILAVEKEIEVLFLDNAGNPIGRIWSSRFGSVSTIRKGQVDFSFSPNAVTWIKGVICKKIENQQALLYSLVTNNTNHEEIIQKTVSTLQDYISKIKATNGENIPDIAHQLRGWEGQSAKKYFWAINHFLPTNYQFSERSQHPALDIVNALLNYGYGILYGKIEGALIKSGIDPYIGIFHRDDYNRPVLAYDVIELYRVWVDYVVFAICCQQIITDECFSQKEDGSIWLEPLGKRILIQSLNDYMDEVILMNGKSRSRLNHIEGYAQQLAQLFKNQI